MDTYLQAALDSAAATAQQVLGESFTLGGATYSGVLHLRAAEMLPGPNGLERIERLEIVATRDQFATAPVPAPRAAVTALSRNWTCVSVHPSALHYFIVCQPL